MPVFAFEQRTGKALALVPLVVRYRLDLCGVKLSFQGWTRLSPVEKLEPAKLDCSTAEAQDRYRRKVFELGADEATPMPAHGGHDGSDDLAGGAVALAKAAQVPASAMAQCLRCACPPPEPAAWRRLDDLQRYALIRLSRPGGKNRHFLEAHDEFGLCGTSVTCD